MAEQTFSQALSGAVTSRRKQLNLTQEQLAELAGCGPVFVIDLEHAKPTLRLDKILAVLNVLGLELTVATRTQGQGKS
jgi:HTH-type transcriptional regulator/antitoxin HipB